MSDVVAAVAMDLSEQVWGLEEQQARNNRELRSHAIKRAKNLWVDYSEERNATEEAKRLTARILETLTLFDEMVGRLKG